MWFWLIDFQYFETDDPELYKTKIKYIEENDIEGMELTFSEEEYIAGQSGPKVWKSVFPGLDFINVVFVRFLYTLA